MTVVSEFEFPRFQTEKSSIDLRLEYLLQEWLWKILQFHLENGIKT